MALAGLSFTWLTPHTPLIALLGVYVLFGLGQGTINPPITNSAVSGMPRSMAGVAASVASTSRQTGVTLGVAVSGSLVGATLAQSGWRSPRPPTRSGGSCLASGCSWPHSASSARPGGR